MGNKKRIVYRKKFDYIGKFTEEEEKAIDKDIEIFGSLYDEEEIEEYNRQRNKRMEEEENDPNVEIVYL